MFPLKDDNPTRRFSVLTLGLILLNAAVFFLEWSLPPSQREVFIRMLGIVPVRWQEGHRLWTALSLISSQFLHGGILHLGGNMLYLWIFGNNIEDHLGRIWYLPFYLGCGLAAGLTQAILHPSSMIPTIGASGAIAGILGAYWILFPRAKVHTLIILIVFIRVVPVPAALWLGAWFLLQLASAAVWAGQEGGVAWAAHAGGFLFGVLVILLLARSPRAVSPTREFEEGGWLRP